MNDEMKKNPSKTVLTVSTPPWYHRIDASKLTCGSVRDLEAQVAAKHEADRLAYKKQHPDDYAKWETILNKEAEARQAIHSFPSLEAARLAAAAVTTDAFEQANTILAERIKGADKAAAAAEMKKIRANRQSALAKIA